MATLKRDFPLSTTPQPAPIKDSTAYYKKDVKNKLKDFIDKQSGYHSYSEVSLASNKLRDAKKNLDRQKLKGKPGYDNMGFPAKKKN
jgi:hypothetical protein